MSEGDARTVRERETSRRRILPIFSRNDLSNLFAERKNQLPLNADSIAASGPLKEKEDVCGLIASPAIVLPALRDVTSESATTRIRDSLANRDEKFREKHPSPLAKTNSP